MKFSILISILWLIFAMICYAEERQIGFIEDFSLSKKRPDVLKQLIPGTEDYYFYHALDAQHRKDFDTVHQLTGQWIKQHGYTERLKQITHRQALLEYDKNPKKSLEYIRQELDLRFDHQKEVTGPKSDIPSALNSELISFSALQQQAFSRYENLDGFEDSGLEMLSPDKLDPVRRRDFLRRLQRPDVSNLAKLVTDDLKYKDSGGFGSFPIHYHLLKSQLDECRKLMPDLADNSNFVRAYLSKLPPGDDVDLRYDMTEKRAYLERLWAYAKTLSPAHNSLKTHALYALLDLNRREGNYDAALFMEYVKLPRNTSYIKPEYLNQQEFRRSVADLNADFRNVTRLSAIGSDEELVRDYLSHFFVKADNFKEYSPYIRDTWLKDVFAETKIVNGIGNSEQWYSAADIQKYQALRDRIDIDFALNNKTLYGADAPVSLDLYIKNVKTLIVKVFEVNAFNYYLAKGGEVDTAIALDGLTATHETIVNYDDPPFRRVLRNFKFEQINRPGVFVVEMIGNGKSSRALIRKATLYALEKIGPAGHEFTIIDDKKQKHLQAKIWLKGREYAPDKDGIIIIPFSTQPGRENFVIKDGDFCSPASFNHLAEDYKLSAGFYADRESLLKGMKAKILIRPTLTLNGHPISLSLLEDVRLSIESADHDGVSSSREIPDFKVSEDKESVFEFQVPDKLSNIRFTLTAKVKNISRDKKEDLSDSAGFAINGIETTLSTEDIFLSHADAEYLLEALGKNGEPKAYRPISIEIKHRCFRETIPLSLQSDASGRIKLGKLEDIERIRASLGSVSHTWFPSKAFVRYPANIHAKVGETIRLPFSLLTSHFSLLERRGSTYFANRSEAGSVKNGVLEISGLEAGDYDIFLKDSNVKIALRLTKGEEIGGCIAGNRILETRELKALGIRKIDVSKSAITVSLEGSSEFTRVHVAATRFMPAFSMFSKLNTIAIPEPYLIQPAPPQSFYVAGRDIGDEYRYILDRKYAKKFPGNMLNRPELLLNPWSIRKTETATDTAGAGEGVASLKPTDSLSRTGQWAAEKAVAGMDNFSGMDFLGEGAVILPNLKPDEKGQIVIDRKLLGFHQQIHLLAVDPLNTAYQEISLPESPVKKRDLRLSKSFDAKKHFIEHRRIYLTPQPPSLKGQGEQSEDSPLRSGEGAGGGVYDSVASMYRFFSTLNNSPDFKEFAFILRWSEMKDKEKEELYSKYSCHELNLFLYYKDKQFFDRVILSYIAHKKDKTFMDRWLLGENLEEYLKPWAFSQLNAAERILLARRLPKEKDRIAKHIKDQVDLIAPDIDTYNRLFDTALRGRSLEEKTEWVSDTFHRGDTKGGVRRSMAKDSEDADMMLSEEAEPEESVKPEMPAPPPAPASVAREAFSGKDKAAAPKEFYKKRAEERKAVRRFFKSPDKTQEWAENNYYHVLIENQNADLIKVNRFWNDYAQSDPSTPFLSGHFLYATGNFTEMMMALAVSDLPITGCVKCDVLSVKNAAIVFHKEIREAAVIVRSEKGEVRNEDSSQFSILNSHSPTPVMVSRSIFQADDRYRYEGHEKFDKFVEGEFLVNTAYGCQFLLSNPTSSRRKFTAMLQIPEGAIPINNGFYSKGIPITLEPYGNKISEYYFYFPDTGNFKQYPAQVAKDEKFIAAGSETALNVVAQLTKIDKSAWNYISQNGSDKDVSDFLNTHNLNRIDLAKIAFRMKDKKFFKQTIAILENRGYFSGLLWSYSVYHNDLASISEYLKHSEYANRCGMYIDTPLLHLDPVERKAYQHLEYKPLVNARAHQLGRGRKILNDRLYDQYHKFMEYLSYRPALDDADMTAVCYYLLLQDRVSESLTFFKQIDKTKLQTQMQYDYLQVYLDFYEGNVERAGKIAAGYADYPVQHWRERFRDAVTYLSPLPSPDRRGAGGEVSTEPGFDFKIEAGRIELDYRNLSTCQISYYPMDIELLFSRHPFVKQETEDFSFIRPNETADISLPKDKNHLSLEIAEKFRNANLMIEITAGGIKRSQVCYANALTVQMIENYGLITVSAAQKPAVKAYIKVYAKMKDGAVVFYKDGYTDLRGRFDYASVSTDDLDRVEKFAILVLSEEYGGLIREALPPKR